MSLWIAAVVCFLLSFVFAWGAAPCWQFERKWRERHGGSPPSELMLRFGLSPAERRRASAKVLLVVGIVIVGISSIFVAIDLFSFAVAVAIAAALGFSLGAALHAFGSGKERINQFFDTMDNEEQA